MNKLPDQQYQTLCQLSERWNLPVRQLLRFHLLGELKVQVWAEEWKATCDSFGHLSVRTLLGPVDVDRTHIEALLDDESASIVLKAVSANHGECDLLESRILKPEELIVRDANVGVFELLHPELREGKTIEHRSGLLRSDDVAQLARVIEFLESSKRGETEPTLLSAWFRHDTWTSEQAIRLLVGLDPDGTIIEQEQNVFGGRFKRIRLARLLDGRELDLTFWEINSDLQNKLLRNELDEGKKSLLAEAQAARAEIEAFSNTYRDMCSVWKSGEHPDRNKPAYYVGWAKAKGFSVPWFQWATEHGLLEEAQQPSEPENERALSTKERTTFLLIIAALAKKAGIDWGEPYKAGEQIAALAQELGATLGDDAVARKLKEIPEALERRTK